jgi:hypothetical protein
VRLPRLPFHQIGEQLNMPTAIAQAAAWRVAAELIRRHPEDLFAIEMHQGTGQYDCLSIFQRDDQFGSPIIQMNQAQFGHISPRSYEGDPELRHNWLDVLLSENLREDVIIPLEQCEGLPTPPETPATTRQSIGPRVIAEALAGNLMSTKRLVASNGVHDSSGMFGSGVCREDFEAFDAMVDQLREADDDRLDAHPAYRFWFLRYVAREATKPVLGIDTWNGIVWSKGSVAGDLMSMYDAADRDIASLTAQLLK